MAEIVVTDARLQVRLRPVEKFLGLLRDLDVPLSAVVDVHEEPNGLAAPRGMRAPGLGMPWVRKIGTWRGRGRKSFVSVRHGQPAVRITLEGQRYDEVVVGVDDPGQVVGSLRAKTV